MSSQPAPSAPSAAKPVPRVQVECELRKHFLAYFDTKLDRMLIELDGCLFERANNSRSNTDQTLYMEGLKALRANTQAVRESFNVHLGTQFDAYFKMAPTRQGGSADLDCDDLELVNQEEWEDDLAVSIMASRADSHCAQILWALNQRLAVIRGGQVGEELENPCGPSNVARAIQVAIKPLDAHEKIKSSIYAQFDSDVLRLMPDYLTEANALMASNGILPNLRFSTRKKGGSPNIGQLPGDADAENKGDRVADAAAVAAMTAAAPPRDYYQREQNILDAIIQWQLQSLARGSTGVTSQGVEFGSLFSQNATEQERFSSEEYVQVLNDLQRSQREQGISKTRDTASIASVEQQLVGELKTFGGKDRRKVSGPDANTIDLVGMIFNNVLDDDSLPANVKALISHLHTPFLKIALLDKQFFAKAEHPARRLVNELAEAGGYWIVDGRDDLKVYDKIEYVVNRIMEDFGSDISFVFELLEEFSDFTANLQKRVALAEKRTSQAEQGLDKLEVARAQAKCLVRRRGAAKNLPLAASDALETTWSDFLVFVYLRFGSDSDTWKKAVVMLNQAVVRVHASILAQTTGAVTSHAAIERIDAALRKALIAAGYAEQDADGILTAMQAASRIKPDALWIANYKKPAAPNSSAAASGNKAAPAAKSAPAAARPAPLARAFIEPEVVDLDATNDAAIDPALATDIALDFKHNELTDDLNEQEQKVRKQLEDIAYGTWFEFMGANGEVERRLKLAWFSSMSGNYMFVNQAGIKVLVEPVNSLATAIHKGKVRISAEAGKSLMERVFGAIVNSLKLSV